MGEPELYHMTWHERFGEPAIKMLMWEDGRKQNVYVPFPFRPYFFMVLADLNDHVRDLFHEVDLSVNYTEFAAVWKDKSLVKVDVSTPDKVRDMRKLIPDLDTFEADVPWVRRVMIDLGLRVSIPTRKLFYDIEVDPRGGFPEPDEATKRIISIAAMDQDGKFWAFSETDERKMIQQFLDLTEEYIVIAGWNTEQFDFPYLVNRCKNLGIQFDWFRVVNVDLLPPYKKMTKRKKPTDYKLDTIGREELGVAKLQDYEAELKVQHLWKLFEENRDLLTLYNVNDARITKLLDDKYKIVTTVFSIARVTHTLVRHLLQRKKGIEPGMNMSIAVDGLILRLATQRTPRVAFPTRHWVEEYQDDEAKIIGGKTIPPVPGLHERVIDLDFSSLYPSVIRTFNIGMDTYRETGGEIKGVIGTFTNQTESLTAEACRIVREEREKTNVLRKKAVPDSQEFWIYYGQQYAMKEVLLSFYGVMASIYSRYYHRDVAENITRIGRDLLMKSKAIVESSGYEVIYGDTDSLFVKIKNHDVDIVDKAHELAELVDKGVEAYCREQYGINEFLVEIGVDRIYSRFYLTEAAKKYAGIVVWQDSPACYLHVVGMELIRKDWPIISGVIQKEVLKMLLSGKTKSEIMTWLNQTKLDLFAGKLNDQLVMRKGIGKEFSEYQSIQPHVKAAQKLMEQGIEVRKGDKITYIRIGPKNADIIPVIGGKVDQKISLKGYSFLWSNSVMPILDRLGLNKMSQRDLGAFT